MRISCIYCTSLPCLIKMFSNTLKILGIFEAAEYKPLAPTPRKKLIIYLSEAFIIHHITAVGTSGMENLNNSCTSFRSIELNEKSLLTLALTHKK